MNEEIDLFHHALNYRGATSENAELFWKELQLCVERMITSECEKENAELLKYLKIAVKEADAWYDETNGGKIPRSHSEEFYIARLMCDS